MDLIASEFGVFPLAVVEFDEIDRLGTEAVMLVLGIAERAVCVGPAEFADMFERIRDLGSSDGTIDMAQRLGQRDDRGAAENLGIAGRLLSTLRKYFRGFGLLGGGVVPISQAAAHDPFTGLAGRIDERFLRMLSDPRIGAFRTASSAPRAKAPPIAGAGGSINTISGFALRMRVTCAVRSVAFIGPITIATIPMPPCCLIAASARSTSSFP